MLTSHYLSRLSSSILHHFLPLALLFLLLVVYIRIRISKYHQQTSPRPTVAIVVLGDIHRSPRMKMHASSLARDAHFQVSLIGYHHHHGRSIRSGAGSNGNEDIVDDANISIYPLWSPPKLNKDHGRLLYISQGFIRTVRQCFDLAKILLWDSPAPRVLLLQVNIHPILHDAKMLFDLRCFLYLTCNLTHTHSQNPPAIPTLFIAQLCRWLLSCKLVIDWHNFGYSLMALNLGGEDKSMIVRLAKL